MRAPPFARLAWLLSVSLFGVGALGGCSGSATSAPGGGGQPGSGGAAQTTGSGGAVGASTGGAVGSTGGVGGGPIGGAIGRGGNAASGAGGRATGGAAGRATGSTGGASATGGRIGAGGTGAGGTATTGGGAGGSAAGDVPFKGVANSPCADLVKFGVTWFYNWTTSPGSCKTPEFVPMVSGKNEKTASAVTNAINQIAKAGHKTVLGFNEPNKSDQANMTVDDVVGLWPQMTANPDLRVGSPATSADGQSWFKDFMTQVDALGLRVDFIALHWYGWNAGSCDAKASQLESYIKWAEGFAGNRPLWLTEWGCMNKSNPDAATVQAFYAGALEVFARHPRVERYAWYPWNTNNELVDDADALTPLGTALAAAPASRN